jgi:hypothetical protein
MMAEIKCPMCGKPNPAELDVCQFCEARLKPVTDELSRSQPPIHPGEEPRDVDTGQLESTLPRWLREIRQNARESDTNEAGQPPAQNEADKEEESDLLARLGSQSKADEEIPDWLAGLRNQAGQAGMEETSKEEDDLSALRSMLGGDTPVTQESESSDLPSWLSDREAEQTQSVAEAPQAEPEADFRWEADFGTEPSLKAEFPESDQPFDTELPAWLQDTDKSEPVESSSGLPAWLDSREPDLGESKPSAEESELPAWLQDKEEASGDEADVGLPSWLGSLGEEEAAETGMPQSSESAIKSTTDWLASLDKETAEEESKLEAAPPAAESALPDWLSSLGQERPAESVPQERDESAAGSDLPAWLAALGDEGEAPSREEALPFEESKKTGWLASLGEESAAEEGVSIPGAEAEAVEPAQAAVEGEIPDWLMSMGETSAETETPVEESGRSMFASDVPAEQAAATPAFIDDEGKPISKEDVEAIFSMDMPDWLSDTPVVSEAEAGPPAPETQGDELRPADLPSWVQAMRPVEAVISETAGALAEEQPVETRGPLTGLRGVLPPAVGAGPSSKPKGYSIKLQVTEDQQSSAALLEKLLSEEASPKGVAPQRAVTTERLLRLVITAVFLVAIALIVFSGTQINPIPTSVPFETKAVVDYVQNELPADSPVLVIFDYEAARAGEMEAAAAPLVDQMLALKAPRLSLVTSNPIGPGLAERFLKLLHTERDFVRNERFTNLGYLSGGAAGVQAFARDPITTKQLTTTGENAWDMPVLLGVENLSGFQAILLLTDDVETARTWIEQTEGQRGEARFLVISSAQSAPMILPYVRSGQVDGMISGLENSAPIEQMNNDRAGRARRYWDAYGFGLLIAVLMIAIGSLWSLVSGWQAARKQQGEA